MNLFWNRILSQEVAGISQLPGFGGEAEVSKTVKSETLPFLQAIILPYFIHAGRRQKKPRLDKKQFIIQYRTVRLLSCFPLAPESHGDDAEVA